MGFAKNLATRAYDLLVRYAQGIGKMKKYASVKVRPKTEAKPSPATLAHNQRLSKNIELLPKQHRRPNYHLNRLSNVTKVFNDWKLENEERYQKINGRKLRSDAHRLESIAIVLSGEQVKECDPDEIWATAQNFKVWFEEKYNTTVRTMDWHRDEGHINDDGEAVINDHIHLEFDNVNFDGKMVRKLFSKGDLIKFQDKIADLYQPLGFTRGENTAKKQRSDKPKRGLGQRAYKARAKAKGMEKTVAKIKKLKENESNAFDAMNVFLSENQRLKCDLVIAEERSDADAVKIKDLKAEIKDLRAELQSRGASRDEYAQLEQLNRDLHKRIKNKDLTISELQNELGSLKSNLDASNYQNQAKDAQIANLKQEIGEMEEFMESGGVYIENRDLKSENRNLRAKIEELSNKLDYAMWQYEQLLGQDLGEESNDNYQAPSW